MRRIRVPRHAPAGVAAGGICPSSPVRRAAFGSCRRSGFARLRTLSLVVGTLVILIAGFLVYLAFQPRIGKGRGAFELEPAPRLPGGHSGPINAGKGVWVKSYDNRGRLSSQLRAVEYDPVGANAIHVTRPEARFFLGDGQVLRITGREGVVITRRQPREHEMAGVPAQMPTRGRLEDVKLELFAPDQIQRLDQDQSAHPTLTAVMNNAVFDSDAFRIYTDDCVIDGKHVSAHEVPVTLTGDDYDFQGAGLLVKWNDQARRLKLLEIYHGDELVVKHGGRGSGFDLQTTGVHSTRPAAGGATPRHSSAVPGAKAKAAKPASTKATEAGEAPIYRANFEQNVRILQNDQLLARADVLQIDFMPKQQSANEAGPASRPASATTKGAAPEHSTTTPASASTEPTSPLVIRWSGPLRVTPVESSSTRPATGGENMRDEPRQPGEAVVRLFGKPVDMTSQGATLKAATVIYHTADAEARLLGKDTAPVVLADAHGSTVTAQSIIYRPRQRMAELFGKGHAWGFTQGGDSSSPERLDAAWSDHALIHFRASDGKKDRDRMEISSALLEGDVRIKHPQLALSCGSLDLEFALESNGDKDDKNSNELQSLLASGDVDATLLDKQNGPRRLEAGRLALTMARSADGRSYPRLLNADDHVRAHLPKEDQRLAADHLRVTLAPTTRPTDSHESAIGLETLHAAGHVDVRDPKSQAMGDDLQLVMRDNQPNVTLSGKPARLLGQNGDELSGPLIHYLPGERRASVIGSGRLVSSQKGDEGKNRPFRAAWQKSVEMNGDADRIDLSGSVTAHSTDAQGSQLTARGDTLTLYLANQPTTRPTDMASGGAAEMPSADFLRDKQIRRAVFTGHASMQSLLMDGDRVLRRSYLESSLIEYDIPKQRLVVPRAGRMLVEDHLPAKSTTTGPSARGNTAFSWDKSLTFDQSTHRASLVGDVHIVHQPDPGRSELPFRLAAQQVEAEFSSAKSSLAADDGGVQLTRLSARNQVHIQSQGRQIDAGDITYDPASGLLKASGLDGNPVRLQNPDGTLRGWFESLSYNLKQDQIIEMKNARFQGQPR